MWFTMLCRSTLAACFWLTTWYWHPLFFLLSIPVASNACFVFRAFNFLDLILIVLLFYSVWWCLFLRWFEIIATAERKSICKRIVKYDMIIRGILLLIAAFTSLLCRLSYMHEGLWLYFVLSLPFVLDFVVGINLKKIFIKARDCWKKIERTTW